MSQTHDTADPDGATDRGPLITLFNGPARTKIIEAFVAERGRDLSVSDVARLSDTARSSVYRHLEELEELGIIEETRSTSDGHSTRYQLDEDSEMAEYLYKLDGVTLQRLLDLDDE